MPHSPYLHICNTFFEKELETSQPHSLNQWMHSHPIILQLQFLPLLFAGPDDKILVSDLPENPDPRLCLIDHPPKDLPIAHWGPSQAIARWAKTHRLPYPTFDWELIRTINSKVFSFERSPQLPGARLLHSQEEIKDWLYTIPGPKVLKTPFGTAGKGHHIIHDIRNVKPLYITPIIGEPWVERVLDFSTQWDQGELLGVTIFENTARGTYKKTYVGPVEKWALEEHLSIARPLVQKIGALGYVGNLGIDAFIYTWQGQKRVQPVVEINARKTMSWVALQRPGKMLSYTRTLHGLLPSRLGTVIFPMNVS